ncbi:MAG: type II toxin-antitoxin system RelE/ParE family toxin [Patescibacteria group bacterium]|nr:type II toxin-antitoxin system RelE/ParE family toxin [Patescibacteria group bacterium]
MDEIRKALQKFNAKEKKQIEFVLKKLHSKNVQGLDIKKLKGRDDIFRIRKGDLRVIYRLENDDIFILVIDRRREDTYKF